MSPSLEPMRHLAHYDPIDIQKDDLTISVVAVMLTFARATTLGQSPAPILAAGALADNSDPPIIDGRVDDAVWQTIKPYTEFTQQDPIEGAPASERTEVRLIVGRGMSTSASSASTAIRRRSSCRRRAATRH